MYFPPGARMTVVQYGRRSQCSPTEYTQFSIESHDSLSVPLVVTLRSLKKYFKTLFFSTYLSIVQHTPAIATIPWQSMDHALILFYFIFVIYVVDSKPT